MDIFKDQDFIPLRTFINASLDLFGKEISYEELAYLILNNFFNLYIRISGNQEMIFLSKENIEEKSFLEFLGGFYGRKVIYEKDKNNITNKEIIKNRKRKLKNKFGNISFELLESGEIEYKSLISLIDTRNNNPISNKRKVIRISDEFNFSGYFSLNFHFKFLEFHEIDNEDLIKSLIYELYIFLCNLLKGISNQYLYEYIDILKDNISSYLKIENSVIIINIDYLFKSEFNFIDDLYLYKGEIQDLLQQTERTSILFKKYNESKQAQREIISLKNKLAYDGNPTEINTLKSIIAGLLCIIDPSRPIDRRYLTKSGKLSKNKLANDVEKCLKTLSPEEIKKVSNRTIRNHFSKITKSKAN